MYKQIEHENFCLISALISTNKLVVEWQVSSEMAGTYRKRIKT